jgi:hypothetical protein
LTPITRRQNKRGREENDEPSFTDIMMFMTNQQMQEMRSREADREEEREERRLRLEEQREERRMQMMVQQQFMTVMMMMVSGRNPSQLTVNATNQDTSEEKREEDSYHTPEGKTPEE